MTEQRAIPDILGASFEPSVSVESVEPLILRVERSALAEVAARLHDDPELVFTFIYSVSGVDYGDRFETVYHLRSFLRDEILAVKVSIDHDEPRCPTVSLVWPGANYHERECFDMFGIIFEGHRDLRHLILMDESQGYLLRKDVPIRTVEEARARAD